MRAGDLIPAKGGGGTPPWSPLGERPSPTPELPELPWLPELKTLLASDADVPNRVTFRTMLRGSDGLVSWPTPVPAPPLFGDAIERDDEGSGVCAVDDDNSLKVPSLFLLELVGLT